MNCKEVQAAMMDWLDHGMPGSAGERMAEHLAGCAECHREADELSELLATMKAGEDQLPSSALRENFHTMLQSEINMDTMASLLEAPAKEEKAPGKLVSFLGSGMGRAAAAVILLAGGIGIGIAIRPTPVVQSVAVIDSLKTEVRDMERKMKEQEMLSLIDDESASERIKAVSYSENMSSPDQAVIDALFHSLNRDKNVNVRLAALYSLSRFADRHAVRDSLVSSLNIQTEPIIQVVLINLLAEKRERKAIAPIREIMTNKKTLKEVKEAAQKSLTVL